jgi:NTP pyrophosphatase (non-canonical NTP hydrolase)
MLDLPRLQERAIQDSRSWFPDVHATRRTALVHFALGIAGETGELVNLVKKWNRGSIDLDDELRQAMAHELADVVIYAMDIATEIGVDLADAIESKRAVLIERWGAPQWGEP